MEPSTTEQRIAMVKANKLADLLNEDFALTQEELEKIHAEAETLFLSQRRMEKMHADVYSQMFANLKN
jgi:hypothetical protein